MAFNFVNSNKKLSQLIAKSWLDGQRLEINKKWLLEQGFISQEEAPYYDDEMILVEQTPSENPDPKHPNGPKYIGIMTLKEEGKLHKYIPYPERPDADLVSDEVLEEWVNSDPDSAPWLPPNPYIPYTC
ncbi:hypothetical protein [Pleurocapsa sp. PCC 7319]|uniref:hypothetical protein n=1 Tax=Pleurocapsa sp. PCC 7319 TaxID=118161 RepID=UPI0003494A84|nr:hypothetical protein [Pleurocapsa sp. PCC 7319]